MVAGPSVTEAFRELRATGDRALRNRLIEQHEYLALHCARRFLGRGEPFDDLVQVARVGVLKAVERYQPDFGTTFATFAVPTILGELRRHFRDATWPIRVPRRVKDRYLEVKSAAASLSQQLGHAPTPAELATALHVTVDEVLEALDAGTNYRPVPLVAPVDAEHDDGDERQEGTTIGLDDNGFDHVEHRLALTEIVRGLPERDRRILHLRYYCGLTQDEIAELVGVSQVHVSRLLRQSLSRCAAVVRDGQDRRSADQAARTA
jgi:RNA polymerase sigma-B factor